MHPPRTLLAATLLMLPVVATAAGTLDRIKSSGAIKLGYGAEARPFSFQDSGGKPLGYGVELCGAVVDRLKADQGMPGLKPAFVQVTRTDRLTRGRRRQSRFAVRRRRAHAGIAPAGLVLDPGVHHRHQRDRAQGRHRAPAGDPGGTAAEHQSAAHLLVRGRDAGRAGGDRATARAAAGHQAAAGEGLQRRPRRGHRRSAPTRSSATA